MKSKKLINYTVVRENKEINLVVEIYLNGAECEEINVLNHSIELTDFEQIEIIGKALT